MPERTGSANRNQTTVSGQFCHHHYMLFGQRQYDQFFLTDIRWQKFLQHPDTKSFTWMSSNQGETLITFRRESRAKGQFWYAYKKHENKLWKVYAGKSEGLDSAKIREIWDKLNFLIYARKPFFRMGENE